MSIGLQMTRVPLPGFEPTSDQHRFAMCLLEPNGPGTYAEIAAYLGRDVDAIEKWFADPYFRQWLLYELDSRAAVQVALIWRKVADTALSALDPKVQLEAARLFLGRFDCGMRLGERDVARATEAFAKTLAEKAVAAAGPKAVHATVVHAGTR